MPDRAANVNGPRISVIIPTYGRGRFLDETLKSIELQTYQPYEVIIVDDASPEAVAIETEYSFNLKLIRHPSNQGQGAARNSGLAHSAGDWVLFLDDDDLLTPNRLQLAVDGMGSSRSHACLAENFFSDGSSIIEDRRRFVGDLRGRFMDGSLPNGQHPLIGQVVHHREDVVQFDPTLRRMQDTEWWLRMEHAAIFAWTEEVGLRVRKHHEPRPNSAPVDVWRVKRLIAVRHGETSSPRRRALLYGKAALAAISAHKRGSAILWEWRAFRAQPTFMGVKRLGLVLWRATVRIRLH